MASLNNTSSFEQLMISSENVENGVNNKHPIRIKCKVQNWKKIATWCLISMASSILLLITIMILIVYSKTGTNRSHLEENQIANKNFLKIFQQSNSTLFNMETQIINIVSHLSSLNATLFNLKNYHTKLERKIDKNSEKLDSNLEEMKNEIVSSLSAFEEEVQDKYDMFNQSVRDLEFDMEKLSEKIETNSEEMGLELSALNSSQTLFEEEVEDKYDMFNQSVSDLEFDLENMSEKIETNRDEINSEIAVLNSSQNLFKGVVQDKYKMFNQSVINLEFDMKNMEAKLASSQTEVKNHLNENNKVLNLSIQNLNEKLKKQEAETLEIVSKISSLNSTIRKNSATIKTHHPFERIGVYGLFYKLNSSKNFDQGVQSCMQLGSHIIEFPDSSSYKSKMNAVINKFELDKFYIGLTDREAENVWKWKSNGQLLWSSHNPWHEGEPNNYNHGSFHEDCVQIDNKEFNDIHCTWTGTIICEV